VQSLDLTGWSGFTVRGLLHHGKGANNRVDACARHGRQPALPLWRWVSRSGKSG